MALLGALCIMGSLVSSMAGVIILNAGDIHHYPEFNQTEGQANTDSPRQAERQMSLVGQSRVLDCQVNASSLHTEHILTWRKKGNEVPIFIQFNGYPPHVDYHYQGRIQLIDGASIRLSYIQPTDEGWYRCHVVYLEGDEGDDTAFNGTWTYLSVSGEELCDLEPETGPCMAAFRRYYHDSVNHVCREFLYGGCGGNANNFETMENCTKMCPESMGPDDATEVDPEFGIPLDKENEEDLGTEEQKETDLVDGTTGNEQGKSDVDTYNEEEEEGLDKMNGKKGKTWRRSKGKGDRHKKQGKSQHKGGRNHVKDDLEKDTGAMLSEADEQSHRGKPRKTIRNEDRESLKKKKVPTATLR